MKDDSTKVCISLSFGGSVLPVNINEAGERVVPLKPIADVIGIEWKRQMKRVSDGYMAKRLGTCGVLMYSAGQQREMVCIRVDRVAAFLNAINPDNLRGMGNDEAADFLEAKHQEWDDVLHAYEVQGGIFANTEQREAQARSRKIRDFLAVSKEKRAAADENDRKALSGLMVEMAADLGVPYQQELDTGTTG